MDESYVKIPFEREESVIEKDIRELSRQGASNIYVEECFLQTVDALLPHLEENKYRVMMLLIQGSSAKGTFFLEKFPIRNV